MSSKREIELRNKINRLKFENKLMNMLSTDIGFFICYYEVNQAYRNKEFAFKNINDIYKKYFEEPKFENLEQFYRNIFKINLN